MKCNVRGQLRKNAVTQLQNEEIKKLMEEAEVEIRERTKAHLISQLMATMCFTLYHHYGFGKQRILQFWDNMNEDMQMLVDPPIGTGIVCAEELIPWVKDKFGLDLAQFDHVERDSRGNIVDKDKEISDKWRAKKLQKG